MELATLREFFMFCTIINLGVLVLIALVFLFAKDFIYHVHSRWFPMSRETFNVVIYCFVGGYKLLWIMFNLIPFLALSLMG